MDGATQFIVFSIEGEDYGIDIQDIHEINRLKEISITEVPKTPDYVEGIINLRGEVVPIVDLRKRFNLPEKEADKDSRAVVVKLDKKMIGLIVDKVDEVITLMPGEIMPPPDEIKDIDSRYIQGVGKKGDKIITILDIKEILDTVEEGG